MNKQQIIALLSAWISQRPGIDARNYISGWNDTNGRRAYNSEVRKVTQQLHDARTLLNWVESSQITADELTAAFRAFSGRLQLTNNKLEYCTGQYWPTEYRAAACAVLASALWDYYRSDVESETNKGEALHKKFVRLFGRGIASRWFN